MKDSKMIEKSSLFTILKIGEGNYSISEDKDMKIKFFSLVGKRSARLLVNEKKESVASLETNIIKYIQGYYKLSILDSKNKMLKVANLRLINDAHSCIKWKYTIEVNKCTWFWMLSENQTWTLYDDKTTVAKVYTLVDDLKFQLHTFNIHNEHVIRLILISACHILYA